MTQTAGIIGAGVAGQAIARFFLTAGRTVVISNSRGPDTLGEVIAGLGAGAEAGTTAQAAQAPLVVLATPWASVEDILAALPSWSGRTLVDATNAFKVFDPPTVELFDFGDRTSSEVVASLAPGASVVKAFNHVPFIRLLSPLPGGQQHGPVRQRGRRRGQGRPALGTRSGQLRRHRPGRAGHRVAPAASGRPPQRAGSAPCCRRVTDPVPGNQHVPAGRSTGRTRHAYPHRRHTGGDQQFNGEPVDPGRARAALN